MVDVIYGRRPPARAIRGLRVIETVLVLPTPARAAATAARRSTRWPSCAPRATRPWRQLPATASRSSCWPLPSARPTRPGGSPSRWVTGSPVTCWATSTFEPQLALPYAAAALLELAAGRAARSAGDGRRLRLPRREGARPPAPRRDRASTTAIDSALRAGDVDALAALDPDRAEELWCEGVPGFHVLGEVARDRRSRRGELRRRAVRRRLVGRPLGPA